MKQSVSSFITEQGQTSHPMTQSVCMCVYVHRGPCPRQCPWKLADENYPWSLPRSHIVICFKGCVNSFTYCHTKPINDKINCESPCLENKAARKMCFFNGPYPAFWHRHFSSEVWVGGWGDNTSSAGRAYLTCRREPTIPVLLHHWMQTLWMWRASISVCQT